MKVLEALCFVFSILLVGGADWPAPCFTEIPCLKQGSEQCPSLHMSIHACPKLQGHSHAHRELEVKTDTQTLTEIFRSKEKNKAKSQLYILG